MVKNIFRHSAVDKLASPAELNKLLVVVGFKGWVVLITLAIAVISIVVWSFIGQIPIIVSGNGILLCPQSQFAVTSTEKAVVKRLLFNSNVEVSEGDNLVIFNNGVTVKAPADGKVFQIDVSQGQLVDIGQNLFWFETKINPENFRVYSFIPLSVGERIKEGMSANVDLKAIDTQKYGQLEGIIDRVAPYAVSANSAEINVIPSAQARKDLTMDQTMELVIIRPEIEPKNETGLKWSAGKGPKEKLSPGSTGIVRVTVENKRPISYLLPTIK